MLVITAIAIAVVSPLLSPGGPRQGEALAERLAVLEARKEVKYGEIRDAELDFRAGKLSEVDYRPLDRALRREAIAVLNEIDELNERSRNDAVQRPRID